MSSSFDNFTINIRNEESIKEALKLKLNPKLVDATLHFIETHFSVKIGDILKVSLEYKDHHGYDCFISVEYFVPLKVQTKKPLRWNKDK